MSLNPVITILGRRLRLALIGGGPGSFIGAMHRQAARLDDRYELVSGVLDNTDLFLLCRGVLDHHAPRPPSAPQKLRILSMQRTPP